MSTDVTLKGVRKQLAVLLNFCTEGVKWPQMRYSPNYSAVLVTTAQMWTQTNSLLHISLLRDVRSFRQVPR